MNIKKIIPALKRPGKVSEMMTKTIQALVPRNVFLLHAALDLAGIVYSLGAHDVFTLAVSMTALTMDSLEALCRR
jgi:hypothetical protein